MKFQTLSFIGLLVVMLASCDTSSKKSSSTSDQTQMTPDNALIAEATLVKNTAPKSYYVTASSGLSLRSGTNLKSKKILTLPYGAEIKFIDAPKNTQMEVAGITGEMIEVSYQGAQGFVFNGYVSSLAPPQPDETIKNYTKRIGSSTNTVNLSEKAHENGENYGMTTSLELPATSWNEMYKISQRLFNLPKDIAPDLSTKQTKLLIENKSKREKTLVDEMVINVNDNGDLKNLVYSYALRDYNRTVTIEKSQNGFTVTEVENSL